MLVKIIPDELLEALDPAGLTVLVPESVLASLPKEDADKIRACDGEDVDDAVYYHDDTDIYLDIVWDSDRTLARFAGLLEK